MFIAATRLLAGACVVAQVRYPEGLGRYAKADESWKRHSSLLFDRIAILALHLIDAYI